MRTRRIVVCRHQETARGWLQSEGWKHISRQVLTEDGFRITADDHVFLRRAHADDHHVGAGADDLRVLLIGGVVEVVEFVWPILRVVNGERDSTTGFQDREPAAGAAGTASTSRNPAVVAPMARPSERMAAPLALRCLFSCRQPNTMSEDRA